MPLTPELTASYEVVLHDLELERDEVHKSISELQARVKELNHSVATLTKRLNPDASPSSSSSNPSSAPNKRYTYMSGRWAILDLLADSKPRSTAEIAAALMAGGVQTRAANYANNVSAVLTTSMKEHDEARQLPDGTWVLTENGKSAIEHIRTTPRFLGALRGRSSARF